MEMVCSNKTQNDYLKYPYTDNTDDDVMNDRYSSVYFVMRAGDKEYPSQVKIRFEISTNDIGNHSDTFYRDIVTEGNEWIEYKFELPHVESVEGWSGVNRFGKRWNEITNMKWYVRYYDGGSTGDTNDSDDIYGASNYIGQTFRATDTDIRQVIVKGKKALSPAGALKCQLYKWVTNYATSISGTLIATGTLAAADIDTSVTILRIPMAMQSGQSLTEMSDYLLHFTQDNTCGGGSDPCGDDSNDYDIRYGTATNENGRYYKDVGGTWTADGNNSLYFTVDYLHRHADYIGIDGLTLAGTDIVHATVTDATSQSNYDTRDYIIRKDDITSSEEAMQKAKQMLRHLGDGSDSWTGSPGDTKDIQNNGFVVVPGRNDLKPTDSVTVQYSEGNLNHDFRIDSISQNIGRLTGWTTTLRLAMILPQMSVQEMLQHIITSINEVKLRKPLYKKELTK